MGQEILVLVSSDNEARAGGNRQFADCQGEASGRPVGRIIHREYWVFAIQTANWKIRAVPAIQAGGAPMLSGQCHRHRKGGSDPAHLFLNGQSSG